LQPLDAERVKEWRHRRMLSQQEVANRAGTSLFTIQRIERGEGNVRPKTGRGVAAALSIPIEELLPKAQAPLFREPPEHEHPLEERRAIWEAAVDDAQRLRDTGRAQMWKALSEWRARKQRGEPYATRRKYLDEMGDLLQEVYDADVAVGQAYIEAALTQGGSTASVPHYLREESRTTSHFYGELLGLVKSAGLSVRTGDEAAAAKRAVKVQPEARPRGVEEDSAA
jgi:transcriptional regulator with XRE-family HTH domain